MLEDLIIETEPVDRTNLSEQEKIVIDEIESFKMITFNLIGNKIYFIDKYGWNNNWWILKDNTFRYSHINIYKILKDKYQYNEQQINDLAKDILLKYYKIKVKRTYSNI